MADMIPIPKMSEILMDEFMAPMNLSAYRLAQEIHVPVSCVQDILHDRRKITADTSPRLTKFFGVSDLFFLDMQNLYRYPRAKGKHGDRDRGDPPVQGCSDVRTANN